VLARVRSEVSTPTALAQLAAISERIDASIYGKRGFKFKPVLLQEGMVRAVRPALFALLGAVAMLLVIMAANLAVLALVRAAKRERELTVRRAIGASHARVTRQILTETLLLSMVGAGVGIALGQWALRALLALSPPGLPRRGEIGIDLTVLAVTLGVAVVVGAFMGLAPIHASLRGDISTVLREKVSSRSGSRVRRALVLGQLALSMVMLAGTGLLLGSFVRLTRVDGGFDPERVLLVEVMASRAKHASGAPVSAVMARYVDALRALPGIVAVGGSMAPPLSAGADQSGVTFPSSPANSGKHEEDRVLADVAPATDDYFRAMGIPILQGEAFTTAQRDSASSRVVIISEDLAKRFYPRGSAIGQPVTIDGDTLRVLGVARHVRLYGMHYEGRPQVWTTHLYAPYRYMAIALRTSSDPMALMASARRAIRDVDPEQPIIAIGAMADRVGGSLAEQRLVLTLVAGFAVAALLLAALGVYGVTASAVSQRTREFGIRMALGAPRHSVLWTVLGEPTRLLGLGLAIGLAVTFAAGRILERLLYGVRPTDPLTLAAVALLLLVVGAVASYLPARRATRVDPSIALRAD
jgi:putative ABC transport system permease protein